MGHVRDNENATWLKFYCGVGAICFGTTATLVGIIYYSLTDRISRLEEWRLASQGRLATIEQQVSFLDREIQDLRRE